MVVEFILFDLSLEFCLLLDTLFQHFGTKLARGCGDVHVLVNFEPRLVHVVHAHAYGAATQHVHDQQVAVDYEDLGRDEQLTHHVRCRVPNLFALSLALVNFLTVNKSAPIQDPSRLGQVKPETAINEEP